ncbi:hypothetical protein BGZ70_007493 [Mortierella alpina]|uniref:Uncharacterized protein n=1 Tax=Mortierella alpina TaxID=64518 RepID=A0A9P6JDU6_MORAP|nr:hypothetical protein BGZ70_007493 [Mortierella alpina]
MLSSVPRSCSMRALFDAPSNSEPKACTHCSEGNDDGSDGNDGTALRLDDEGKQEPPSVSRSSLQLYTVTTLVVALPQ